MSDSTGGRLARRRFLGSALAAWVGSSWLGGLFQSRPAAAQLPPEDTPFVGELRLFAGSVLPAGWAFCQGQLLVIAEYETLFQLIGTTYGGDGQSTFALPDLRGRVPVHTGTGFILGQMGGDEQVTLTINQIPAHTHAALASSAIGTSADPAGRVPARNAAGVPQYSTKVNAPLSPAALDPVGGSISHNNVQPFLGVHFMIALDGIFPSPS